MYRTRFADDLAPGDRIAIENWHGTVRKNCKHGTNDRLIELVMSSDNRNQIVLKAGEVVEVL
ncbi:hypothetical protein [Gordonia sp. (in: high G+C Gram-positive bacteria)]|jgi:hypothetical protein|uniref:hypothetical protein n=1 Tax=Gordonia sp. (in: high G+C Gram-positive bacteria) TaxID=84139 RepID=UPI001D79EA7C|nr:hypothetical protein [Gordonia sp. (in: high G+C Gram-positive bacteria)]MCB1296936.1 hypothetical protein [Gordonia sp. (in: high G+C Gram-positive bacteria)]HMS77072.1 hypothetical protein [Gordonia sp. (in: high G+C Gram-positive bacteria)]HQV18078.1 hypothetical protein [Gordonia sp. (in: high G+C Gram-positive bacteria)]